MVHTRAQRRVEAATQHSMTGGSATLPDELLLRVLEHLMRWDGEKQWRGGVRGVSRTWRALHDGACTRLHLRNGVTDEGMRALCGRLPALKTLRLRREYHCRYLELVRAVTLPIVYADAAAAAAAASAACRPGRDTSVSDGYVRLVFCPLDLSTPRLSFSPSGHRGFSSTSFSPAASAAACSSEGGASRNSGTLSASRSIPAHATITPLSTHNLAAGHTRGSSASSLTALSRSRTC
jgi:hypothetical protein